MNDDALQAAAHIVQLALTPVFLLSGIAALLNVFATRLARVADQTDKVAADPKTPLRDKRLRVLRWRSLALDWAVVLAALAGSCTCGTVLTLFLGAVRGAGAASLLFILFGGAIVLTMGSLTAFVVEMLLAADGVRRVVNRSIDGVASISAVSGTRPNEQGRAASPSEAGPSDLQTSRSSAAAVPADSAARRGGA
jgi:hypothetical protein